MFSRLPTQDVLANWEVQVTRIWKENCPQQISSKSSGPKLQTKQRMRTIHRFPAWLTKPAHPPFHIHFCKWGWIIFSATSGRQAHQVQAIPSQTAIRRPWFRCSLYARSTLSLICSFVLVVVGFPYRVLDDIFWGRQLGSHFSHKIMCNKLLCRRHLSLYWRITPLSLKHASASNLVQNGDMKFCSKGTFSLLPLGAVVDDRSHGVLRDIITVILKDISREILLKEFLHGLLRMYCV